MNTKISTFIFDCFGVVCSPAVNGWYRENRLNRGLIDENLPIVLKQFDLGELTEVDIAEYFSEYRGVTKKPDEIRAEIDSYLNTDSRVVDIIRHLKGNGFKVALMSNANNSFFERVIYPRYPFFKDLFDKIIISSVVGMVKPDADIYLYALAELKSRPEETLFIDDSVTNVDAAKALGMNGHLFTTSQSLVTFLERNKINL
ncbi:HAD family phosphatase [Patescibacteria group bacterium]|nr:HAD family phosphatase [Patescibacteria group bacterium]